MGKDEKLIERFKGLPKDFAFSELVRLLRIFGYEEYKTGKTSGSGVKFRNVEFPERRINFHKPHPSGILKRYILVQIMEVLQECGYIEKNENDKEEE